MSDTDTETVMRQVALAVRVLEPGTTLRLTREKMGRLVGQLRRVNERRFGVLEYDFSADRWRGELKILGVNIEQEP